jgi:hypothetical protein
MEIDAKCYIARLDPIFSSPENQDRLVPERERLESMFG